ncbi:MAG: PRC-barrel domain protein [Firmicutes bacterium]|nr:PRC-barrel domain protein [Bacillota bacterium]
MLSTATNSRKLHRADKLSDYSLRGIDGNIGTVKEFYFDDSHWTIRYIIANTGNWLSGRQVLISPHSLGAVNNEEEFIAVNLTQKQMEDSPTFKTGQTVSRQFEYEYNTHYGLPTYWNGTNVAAAQPNIERDTNMPVESVPNEQIRDHQLHNTSDVSGYDIEASDGEIGDVKDFIIDDETWAIRYLIVDTGGWLPGKKVLIAPQWIERVSWEESKVFVNLSRDAIEKSPEFTEELTRDYEAGLYKHYNRQGYWID